MRIYSLFHNLRHISKTAFSLISIMDVIKSMYKAPEIAVWEIIPEGIICESPTEIEDGPEFNGFNDEDDWS